MKLFGHEAMSREALAQFIKGLPPNLKFLGPLLTESTVHHALNRDVLDVVTLGHWKPAGQKHHFMRAGTETQRQAYDRAVRWIAKNGREAAHYLRRLFQRGTTRNFSAQFIAGPLGYAFHAVQDSYAPMHVTRQKVGSDFVITKIHVYTEQDSKVHGASDIKASKNIKGPLGQDAIKACRELSKMVVVTSLQKEDGRFQQRWDNLWRTYVSMFLRQQLGAS